MTISAAIAIVLSGCRNETPTAETPAPAVPAATAETKPPDATGTTPPVTRGAAEVAAVRAAVEQTLASNAKVLFPEGTKLQSVQVADGVVSLDFSKEFNGLANMGETTESEAQKSLQKTLAAFSTVEKMRVTVDSNAFESQATDWGTAFPVRATLQNVKPSTAETDAPPKSAGASR